VDSISGTVIPSVGRDSLGLEIAALPFPADEADGALDQGSDGSLPP